MSSFRQDVTKLREVTAQQVDFRQALRDRDETIRGEKRRGGFPFFEDRQVSAMIWVQSKAAAHAGHTPRVRIF